MPFLQKILFLVFSVICILGIFAIVVFSMPQKIAEKPVAQLSPLEKPQKEKKEEKKIFSGSILYAIKNGKQVLVMEKNISSGEEKKIFEYTESVAAENSGNLWEGLPPSVALSPDKRKITFITEDGLGVYDIAGKSQKMLIQKRPEKITRGEFEAPLWSEDALQGVFWLAAPKWSSDGRYLSFLQAYYEGSHYGIFDTEKNEYFSIVGGGEKDFVWSPVGAEFVVADENPFDPVDIFRASQEKNWKLENISPFFGKKRIDFDDASYSPKGDFIAFLYRENQSDFNNVLAILHPDGTGFKLLSSNERKKLTFFSPSGEQIYFISEGAEKKLSYIDLRSGEKKAILDLPEEFTSWQNPEWVGENLLSLTGAKENSKRVLLIDTEKNEISYESDPLSVFTIFLDYETR